MTQWHVVHSDILDYPAGGLLCSANPYLNLSGGVGGAFALRYGDTMQAYLHSYLAEASLSFLNAGDSVIAPPCGWPYLAVAQAVSVDGFYDTDAETILRAYDSAIRGLAEHGCSTIAAACLGCGYGRVSDMDFTDLSSRLFQTRYDLVTDIWLVTTNLGLADSLSRSLEDVNN